MWMATRPSLDEPFSDFVSLGPGMNSSENDVVGSVSSDGLTLYFSSRRNGNPDLYQATRTSKEATFGDVRPLGDGVNTDFAETSTRVSPDGRTLIHRRDLNYLLQQDAVQVIVSMAAAHYEQLAYLRWFKFVGLQAFLELTHRICDRVFLEHESHVGSDLCNTVFLGLQDRHVPLGHLGISLAFCHTAVELNQNGILTPVGRGF